MLKKISLLEFQNPHSRITSEQAQRDGPREVHGIRTEVKE